MNRQDKINKIYEKIANKELNFGCKIKFNDDKEGFIRTYVGNFNQKQILGLDNIEEFLYHCKLNGNTYGENKDTKFEIIGHTVMIGDVLDRMEGIKSTIELRSSEYCAGLYDDICIIWEHKRKPIEEQSELCISYIYDLIKNN